MRCRRRSRATCSTSGDWVTARLDGVAYLEKAPLIYWVIAGSYNVFGVHDWAARIPIALSAMALCWLTAAFRHLGLWETRGALCRADAWPLRRPVALYARS